MKPKRQGPVSLDGPRAKNRWELTSIGPAYALSRDYLLRTLRPRLIELTVRIEAAMLRRSLGTRAGRTRR